MPRSMMRTKTGIILFLSTTLIAAVCLLVFIISGFSTAHNKGDSHGIICS